MNMTMTIRNMLFILAIITMAFGFGMTGQAWAQSSGSKNKDITYTGDHRQNKRVKAENGKVVIVHGLIYSVRGDIIVMDGESFSLVGVNIHDQLGIPLKVRDLSPGHRAKVVLRNGSVVGATITNFSRGMVVTDPKVLEIMRQREIERQGR